MENHDSTQAFAELLAQSEENEKKQGRIQEGKKRKGTIFEITPERILVDLHYKANGILLAEEYTSEDMYTQYSVGQEVEWFVKSRTPDGIYLTAKSPEKYEKRRTTNPLFLDEEQWKDKEFDALITEVVNKGVSATIEGERVFIPRSTFFVPKMHNQDIDLASYVGKIIKAKIIEVVLHSSKEFATSIVASVQETVAREAAKARLERRKAALENIHEGDIIHGKVARIEKYGALVDLGVGDGIYGLIYRSAVSWEPVENIADCISVGEEVDVKVISVDMDKLRVTLSRKALLDRWTVLAPKYDNYNVGDVVEGKITQITESGKGAFVEIEPGLSAYLPIAHVDVKRTEKIEDVINVGDTVRVKIIELDKENHRISVSRKDVILDENPEIAEEYRAARAARMSRFTDRRDRAEAGGERRRTERQPRTGDRQTRSEIKRGSDTPRSSEPRPERRRQEEPDYTLPEQERSTTSLGSLLKGIKVDD